MLTGFTLSKLDPSQRRWWLERLLTHAQKRLTPLGIGLFFLVMSTLLVAMYWFQFDEPTRFPLKTVTVSRQSFLLQVHERGHVRPARVVALKSPISSNRAKLVWLEDEGSQVDKGSIIARFDTQPFNDALEKAEQNLADAKARLQDADKALKLQEEVNQAKLEASRRKLEIAQIQAEDLRSGSGRLERAKLLMKIKQSERSQQVSGKELDDFEALLRKGHISQRERDIVAIKFRKQTETLELHRQELNNFDRYEMPRLLREADLMLDAANNDLQRVRRTSVLEMKRRGSEVIKQKRDLEVALQREDRARRDIVNSDVRAPIEGTLLYVMLPRSEQMQKVQVGDAIWFGQSFMEIPDTRDLVVELYVREIDVTKLAPGMVASIELDAFPGRRFGGQLLNIESLAQTGDEHQHASRFKARVKFNDAAPGVHVGMSADVRINYHRLDDVISVPTAAIEFDEGLPMVRLRKGNQGQRVNVELGEIGPMWAEIRSGLKIGDEIEVNGM
jgi:multidrug efflux pump subunit AcrA (membrane-fusion protein)